MSYNSLFGLGTHSADANLAGWWPMQDNAASTVVSAQAGAVAGTLVGGDNTSTITTTGPNSWLTRALNLDGSADAINIADSASWTVTTAITFGCRLKPDTSKVFQPVRKGLTLGVGLEWLLQTDASNNMFAQVQDASSFQVSGSLALGTGSWVNVSGRYNGSNVYARANKTDSTAGAFTGTIQNYSEDIIFGGRLTPPSSYDRFFDGAICDGFLFTRALSTSELDEWEDGPEPINTVAPVVSGTETQGQTLSCTTGTWGLDSPFSGGSNGTITYSYQWTRSNDGSGTGEADIGSATSSTYTLQAADIGKYIRCRVRGTNTGGFDSAEDTNSNFTGAIASSDSTPPTLSSATIAANGTTFTAVFSENVNSAGSYAAGFSISASGGAATLSYSSGDGTDTIVFTVSRTINQGESVTFSYSSGTGDVEDDASNALASFTGTAVTNNSTQDTVDPQMLSATFITNDTQIRVSMSETVSNSTGFSVDSGTISYLSGSGSSTYIFDITSGSPTTITYTRASGNVVDGAGNELVEATKTIGSASGGERGTVRPVASSIAGSIARGVAWCLIAILLTPGILLAQPQRIERNVARSKSTLALALADATWKDGEEVTTLGHTSAGDAGGNSYIYRASGWSGLSAIQQAGPFYKQVSGDRYLEVKDKTVITAPQCGIFAATASATLVSTWQQFSVDYTPPVNRTPAQCCGVLMVTSGDSVSVWGGQLRRVF